MKRKKLGTQWWINERKRWYLILNILLWFFLHWFEPSIRNAVWNLWPMKCNFPAIITFSDICGARHCSWPSVYFHERQAAQHAVTVWQDKMWFKECTGPWFHFSSEGTYDPMSYKKILRFPSKFATDDAFQATGMSSRPETC